MAIFNKSPLPRKEKKNVYNLGLSNFTLVKKKTKVMVELGKE